MSSPKTGPIGNMKKDPMIGCLTMIGRAGICILRH
ncbi:hypothetical protein V1293_004061 [Bradyrhizobium sp. AZCC 1693]